MDRLSDMRLLVDAADLASFSAAARRHGISPAAASARILRIEAELGAKLFERTTRHSRLTDEGRRYLHYCRQALETMEEAARALQSGPDQIRGTIRISAPSDLGRNLLLRMLDGYMRAHPEIRLALTLTDSLSNLVQEDHDVAIRVGRLPDSPMVARRLAHGRRVVCASPDCLARHGEPRTAGELAELPALVLATRAGPLCEWRLGSEIVQVRRYHESSDSEVVRKWALRGHGFAYRSIWGLVDDVRNGGLSLVHPGRWSDYTPVHALYHRTVFQPARLRLLLDFLAQQFAEAAKITESVLPGATSRQSCDLIG
jgi:DNA-binding transcriptional LysR family regulator